VEYTKLGRKLGIGTRVAAKILRESAKNVSANVAKAPVSTAATSPVRADQPRPSTARPARNPPRGEVIRNVAAGGRGFGRGFWKSFATAFKALWHQITGVFFAIFAVFFAQNAWRLRAVWQSGPNHRYFVIYFIVALLFIYFSITAFVRASRSSS